MEIYTDGACRGNPGPGGWAFEIWCDGESLAKNSGGFAATTNNRMEIRAAIFALKFAAEKFQNAEIEIFTDSQFLKNGAEIWLKNWQKNNWKTSARKPVKNRDLWEKLAEFLRKSKVKFTYVPAHRGILKNEKVDRAAAAAADEKNLPSENLTETITDQKIELRFNK